MKDEIKKVITTVAGQLTASEKKDEELVQLVVFAIDGEEYAIRIADASEIIKVPLITSIPGAPEFIRGIVNLRGKIIVVIDLEKRFHLSREHPIEAKHILVTEVGENMFGVTVDEVVQVLHVPISMIQQAPALVTSKIHTNYISGVIVLNEQDDKDDEKRNARLIMLLDLQRLLQEKELLEIGQAIKEVKN